MKRFHLTLFPARGDGFRRAALKIAALVCVCALVGCAAYFGWYELRAALNRRASSEIAARYSPSSVDLYASSGDSASSSKYPSDMLSKFYSLYDINRDIRGWISIPGTNINYPVMQSSDNAYYLTHDIYNKYSWYGTPFLDFRCLIAPLSSNMIVYGHNMGDDQMFHELVNYKKADFYKTSPFIEFDTLSGMHSWKIFAVFIANTDPNQGDVFNYLIPSFASDLQFEQQIADIRKRSLINVSLDVTPQDHLLTLSTCTYEFKEARFVVVARLRRDDESNDAVDCVQNPSPLMPDIWYQKFGGKKPS